MADKKKIVAFLGFDYDSDDDPKSESKNEDGGTLNENNVITDKKNDFNETKSVSKSLDEKEKSSLSESKASEFFPHEIEDGSSFGRESIGGDNNGDEDGGGGCGGGGGAVGGDDYGGKHGGHSYVGVGDYSHHVDSHDNKSNNTDDEEDEDVGITRDINSTTSTNLSNNNYNKNNDDIKDVNADKSDDDDGMNYDDDEDEEDMDPVKGDNVEGVRKLSFESCTKYPINSSPRSKKRDYSVQMPTDMISEKHRYHWIRLKGDLEKFQSKEWDYKKMKKFVEEHNSRETGDFKLFFRYFKSKRFVEQLPDIAKLALKLPDLFKKPVPILLKGHDEILTLTQLQIACLLAHAFFCCFYKKKSSEGSNMGQKHNKEKHKGWKNNQDKSWWKKDKESSSPSTGSAVDREAPNMPTINFSSLYHKRYNTNEELMHEKFKCIMHYFKRVVEAKESDLNDRKVTYHRQVLKDEKKIKWGTSKKSLCDLKVVSKGAIENAKGLLQVDFANKMVGGGVLGRGCVQEEIRFLICPELIASRLFTEELNDDECLIVTGIERFSDYEGYSHSFKRKKVNYKDGVGFDGHNRRMTQVVAMDALHFKYESEQFAKDKINRELNKAYCSFMDTTTTTPPAVATGNWGCGAFKGDKQLKFLIQLIAASEANREMCYYSFNDGHFTEEMKKIYEKLRKSNITTVGELYQLVIQVSDYKNYNKNYNEPILSSIEIVIRRDDKSSQDHSTQVVSNNSRNRPTKDSYTLNDSSRDQYQHEKDVLEEYKKTTNSNNSHNDDDGKSRLRHPKNSDKEGYFKEIKHENDEETLMEADDDENLKKQSKQIKPTSESSSTSKPPNTDNFINKHNTQSSERSKMSDKDRDRDASSKRHKDTENIEEIP